MPNYSSAFLNYAKIQSAKLLKCLLKGTPVRGLNSGRGMHIISGNNPDFYYVLHNRNMHRRPIMRFLVFESYLFFGGGWSKYFEENYHIYSSGNMNLAF